MWIRVCPAHGQSYNVFETPPDAPEQQIAHDYGFRTEQSTVDSLDHAAIWSGLGSFRQCNLTICPAGATTLSRWPDFLRYLEGPRCSPSPRRMPTARAATYDVDGDADVDLRDFSLWLSCFTFER